MNYYKVEFERIPRVLLAARSICYHNEYHYEFLGDKEEIEVTYLKNSGMKKIYGAEDERFVYASQTNVRLPFECYRSSATNPLHEHYTMIFTGYSNITEIDSAEVVRLYRSGLPPKTVMPMAVLLPSEIVSTPPKIEGLIMKMIELFSFGSNSKDLKMISCLFHLLAEITEYATSQAFKELNKSGLYSYALYSNKVMKYISAHINEKITVNDLACHVGVTNEHLSRIFKNETGQTLISYINMVKLENIKELINTKNVTLKEAGLRFGIENECYLNRIFKKYTGLTSTEYKKLHEQ